MRAALSILGLVVVLAIVLLSAKKQMQAQMPAARPAASAAAAPGLPSPQAVGQQVQGLIDQAAQRASEAQP